MIDKAKMLKRRLKNVLTYTKHRITNAVSEGLKHHCVLQRGVLSRNAIGSPVRLSVRSESKKASLVRELRHRLDHACCLPDDGSSNIECGWSSH
jgi:hypothetical protein